MAKEIRTYIASKFAGWLVGDQAEQAVIISHDLKGIIEKSINDRLEKQAAERERIRLSSMVKKLKALSEDVGGV